MADPTAGSSAKVAIVSDSGEDLLAHLERKKQEVHAFQEAAEVAREGALALLRAQRRAAELDDLAYGDGPLPDAEGGASQLHEHPLIRSDDQDAWICDGCRTEFPDPVSSGVKRFQCTQGCDFDLCGECQAGSSAGGPSPTAAVVPPAVKVASPSGKEASNAAPSPLESCLSPEDRRRFGLDISTPEREAAGSSQPSCAASSGDRVSSGGGKSGKGGEEGAPVPGWSTLSAEDRKRFGLDGPAPVVQRAVAAGNSQFGSAPTAAGQARFQHHPEVLWGPGKSHGDGAMQRTLAQLEAVGVISQLADIQETERQLQFLKMQG